MSDQILTMADINRELHMAQKNIRAEAKKIGHSAVFPAQHATAAFPQNPHLLRINTVQTKDGRSIPIITLQVAYKIKGIDNVVYWNIAL